MSRIVTWVTWELLSFLGTLVRRGLSRDCLAEGSSPTVECLSWDLTRIGVSGKQFLWQYWWLCISCYVFNSILSLIVQPKHPEGSPIGGLAVGCPPKLFWTPSPLKFEHFISNQSKLYFTGRAPSPMKFEHQINPNFALQRERKSFRNTGIVWYGLVK